jgi:hypothetical protein
LDAVRDAANQVQSLFSIEGPARNLMNIITARTNVCTEVESQINSLFNNYSAVPEPRNPLEQAGHAVGRSAGYVADSMLYLVGMGGISASAQDKRQEEIDRDNQRLRDALNRIEGNDDGCYLGLVEKDQIANQNDEKELLKASMYKLGDYAATGKESSAEARNLENEVQGAIRRINENKASGNTPKAERERAANQNNSGSQNTGRSSLYTNPENLYGLFDGGVGATDILGKQAELSMTTSRITNVAARAVAEKKEQVDRVTTNPDTALAIREGVCDTKSKCATVECAPVAGFIASSKGDDKNTSCIGVNIVTAPSKDAQFNALFQAINQRSQDASSSDDNDIVNSVVGLVNEFLDKVFNSLIDTLFGFIQDIVGGFCYNLNIGALCGGLSETSRKWQENIRKDVKTVRINTQDSGNDLKAEQQRRDGNQEKTFEVPTVLGNSKNYWNGRLFA